MVPCPATRISLGDGPPVSIELLSVTPHYGASVALTLNRPTDAPPIVLMRYDRVYLGDSRPGRFPVNADGLSREILSLATSVVPALASAETLTLMVLDGTELTVPLDGPALAVFAACVGALPAPAPAPAPAFAIDRLLYQFSPLPANRVPVPLTRGQPDYPAAALRERRSGNVTTEVAIDRLGRVTGCSVVASSGHADLDAASCGAVRRSRYRAATDADSQPVASTRQQSIAWRLPPE